MKDEERKKIFPFSFFAFPLIMLAELHWHLKVDNPSFTWWFIAASYVVTALLCFLAGLSAKRRAAVSADKSYIFWYILAVVLFLLGINKQLAFQLLLSEVGGNIAKTGGWYENRRLVQAYFLAGVAAAGAIALVYFSWLIRRAFWRQVSALVGVLVLVCFIMIRAISIEHIDMELNVDLGGVQVHSLLEFGAILIIAITAALNLARPKSSPPPWRPT